MRIFCFLLAASALFGQSSTYLGPKSPVSGVVRVEILIQDSPELGGIKIQSASFNQNDIPLKPADVNGYRGGASFQLPPGKYSLTWTVQRDKTYWPRNISFAEEVTISPKDQWIQITIVGQEASIR